MVRVRETFKVNKTGVTYTKGQEVEVSDELAKRHGKDGSGYLEAIKTKITK